MRGGQQQGLQQGRSESRCNDVDGQHSRAKGLLYQRGGLEQALCENLLSDVRDGMLTDLPCGRLG